MTCSQEISTARCGECGCAAGLFQLASGSWVVECRSTACDAVGPAETNQADAIERWNAEQAAVS